MKKIVALLICAGLCLGITGCKKALTKDEKDISQPGLEQEITNSKMKIYIGRGSDFLEYEEEYNTELTVSMLLENISKITGWDLSITKDATVDISKCYIDFAAQSILKDGNSKSEEFAARDKDETLCMVLDSVTKTLEKSMNLSEIIFTCEGSNIYIRDKNISESGYEVGENEKYTQEEAEEFLKNYLSNYYDTPTTKYEKYGEVFENGKREYIYNAVDKNTNELLGTYKLSSDLWELYEKSDEEYKLIWSMESLLS